VDFTSRLRAVVNSGPAKPVRELTYEPDDGYRNGATLDLDRVAESLGGRRVSTRFGECLVIDRRYESDRWHGGVRIGDCELADLDGLRLLDPNLTRSAGLQPCQTGSPEGRYVAFRASRICEPAGPQRPCAASNRPCPWP
jgi:hypothetical protein